MTVSVSILSPDGVHRDITDRTTNLQVTSAVNVGFSRGSVTLAEPLLTGAFHLPQDAMLWVHDGATTLWCGFIETTSSQRAAGERRMLEASGPAVLMGDDGSLRRVWSDSRLDIMRYETTAAQTFSGSLMTQNPAPGLSISPPALYWVVPPNPATPVTLTSYSSFFYEVAQQTGQTLGRVTFNAHWSLDVAKMAIRVNAYANQTLLSNVYTSGGFGIGSDLNKDFSLPAGTNRVEFVCYSVNGTAVTAGDFAAFDTIVIYSTTANQTADVIFDDLIGQVPGLTVADELALTTVNVSPFVFDDPTTAADVAHELAALHPDRFFAVWGPKTPGFATSGFEADWSEKGSLDRDLVDHVFDANLGQWQASSSVTDVYHRVAVGYMDSAGNRQSVVKTGAAAVSTRIRTASLNVGRASRTQAELIADAFLEQHAIPRAIGTYTTNDRVLSHPSQSPMSCLSLLRAVGRTCLVVNTGGEDVIGFITEVVARPFERSVTVHVNQTVSVAAAMQRLLGHRRKATTQPILAGTGQWAINEGVLSKLQYAENRVTALHAEIAAVQAREAGIIAAYGTDMRLVPHHLAEEIAVGRKRLRTLMAQLAQWSAEIDRLRAELHRWIEPG